MAIDRVQGARVLSLHAAEGSPRPRSASDRSQGLGFGALPRVVGGLAESVTLPAELASARRARLLVQRLCQQLELSSALVQEAMVLTSEVVTNAVRHGAGNPHLSVVVTPAGVYVEVEDDSCTLPPVQPVPHPPSTVSSGRGLAILHAWADEWGACVQPSGKVVWFEMHAT